MKVVIAGCGRVGSTLAKRLDSEGHRVTVIDERLEAFDRLGDEYAGERVLGTALDEETLRRAGIETADAFASVTNGDNRNLMAAQIAKAIFNVPRVITRLYDPIRAAVYRELGMETFCSTTIGSNLIHEYFVTGANRSPVDEIAPRREGG